MIPALNRRLLRAWAVAAVLAGTVALAACDLIDWSTDPKSPDSGGNTDSADIGPADPPYTASVTYPSGLRLDGLVRDGALSATYPSPSASAFPFDGGKARHYQAVGYFIDIPSLSSAQRQEQVAENFILNEYVKIPEANGDPHIYVDAQIALHAQDLRDAWGGPLILSSTYRSPEYNDAIGGAVYSRHQFGDAVDVKAPSVQTAQDLYNLARYLDVDYLEPASLTIVGKNTPWIHLDDRGWPVNTPDSR